MDIASLIGLLGAIGMILGAMISGGGIGPFIDVPSILIVFGGTFFAVMYTAPLPVFLGSFGVMAKGFLPPVKKMDGMIERMVDLAGIARKDGMMALEGQEVPDAFFEKGLQMLVDGAERRTDRAAQAGNQINEVPTRGQPGRDQGLGRSGAGHGNDRNSDRPCSHAW